ncbi:transporter substrate-binding domain-containing protein [Rhizobium calliandrae]|uniref:Transporter substrate-binding domain-containing protein n=1 Tax=Rhizobium calliandrae TaxID=1312182 RepID=A0ABT7KDF2_9HYPH|nr:transporter substrate-binding domain-containing protein [Rhizobium calliandrae]MDL2405993.1 transporter substrate-binding domain-containing protein [Rhizobium calliandrae]
MDNAQMPLDLDAALAELTPTGKLRVGIIAAPTPSVLFARHEGEEVSGVTVDLAQALASQLGAFLDIVVFMNSGACTEALEKGAIDVSFMPVDEERRKRVAFGPAYYLLESTYLVTGVSGIRTLAEIDREGIRVVGIANTTTIRASTRSLTKTVPMAQESIAAAVDLLLTGQAEALALSRDAFHTLLPKFAGARVLDGGFQQTGIAIAVAKNRPAALALVTAFMNDAKSSGLVRRALDAAGFAHEPVASLSA